MKFKDTLEYKQYEARQKMNDRKEAQILKIVESISRLDEPQLAVLGDLAAERNLADKIIFVCEVAMREKSLKEKGNEQSL